MEENEETSRIERRRFIDVVLRDGVDRLRRFVPLPRHQVRAAAEVGGGGDRERGCGEGRRALPQLGEDLQVREQARHPDRHTRPGSSGRSTPSAPTSTVRCSTARTSLTSGARATTGTTISSAGTSPVRPRGLCLVSTWTSAATRSWSRTLRPDGSGARVGSESDPSRRARKGGPS